MTQEVETGQKNPLFQNKIFRSFLIFSIFRAIYGAGIVVITYFLATSGDSPLWISGLFLISSMVISRVIFRWIKGKWPELF
ncbi:MAG: hypothetical protein CMA28_04070 [Euryarchaeota archaeon]|mgnify:CR=1 FL=1|nr:hypothetical protein [Euryarchaeota archaeon]MAS80774.1 hypothetical protein [Euryarchaeota archaeon]|tara:strand:- start:124 stop:366 length:243 start_codon:yes stop_codon:yes gene_type:complete